MIENELKARLQHAVEHTDNNTQYPANDSVPLNGEIVFNNTRTNFKVGNGSSQYSALSDFLPPIPAAQVNSDWNASSGVAQILNKPTIPAAQIQSDWNQTDDTSKDYIKNKPTIPAAQIQSDWNQTDNTQKDFIKNKPSIPAAQVNSDWNAQSGVAQILNKPTTETWTFTTSAGVTVTKHVLVQ